MHAPLRRHVHWGCLPGGYSAIEAGEEIYLPGPADLPSGLQGGVWPPSSPSSRAKGEVVQSAARLQAARVPSQFHRNCSFKNKAHRAFRCRFLDYTLVASRVWGRNLCAWKMALPFPSCGGFCSGPCWCGSNTLLYRGERCLPVGCMVGMGITHQPRKPEGDH